MQVRTLRRANRCLQGVARRRERRLRDVLVQRLEEVHRERAAHHEPDAEGQRSPQRHQGEHGGENAGFTPDALLQRVVALAAAQAVDGRDDQEPHRERDEQALERVADDVCQGVYHVDHLP